MFFPSLLRTMLIIWKRGAGKLQAMTPPSHPETTRVEKTENEARNSTHDALRTTIHNPLKINK